MNILTHTVGENIYRSRSVISKPDRKEYEREHVQIIDYRVWTETAKDGGKYMKRKISK
jgi:hypothetical protein